MRSLVWRGLTMAVSLGICPQLQLAADTPAKPPVASTPAKGAPVKPKADPPSKTEPQDAARPATVAFNKLFDDWRELLAKIRHVQERYQLAPSASRPPLVKEFDVLLEQGRDMATKLTAAAEKAYIEYPDDSRVSDFLLSVEADNGRTDNYEEAYRLGNLLIEHGCKKPAVYNITGIAAFCLNDYPTSRKNLQLAADAKELSEAGQKFLGLLDKYKEPWKKESELRAAEAKADDLPRVKLSTSKGDIVVELFENEAPNTTANFISLVEKGLYDNTPFHRVLAGFMAQGGDPQGNGQGGPGYTIACECYVPERRNHFRGSLSMAHAGRDTGGSQFFLTFVPTDMLNGKHTVFGRIIEGIDVLAKLQRIDPEHPHGEPPDRILKASVLRQRNHDYVPVKKSA